MAAKTQNKEIFELVFNTLKEVAVPTLPAVRRSACDGLFRCAKRLLIESLEILIDDLNLLLENDEFGLKLLQL